MRLARRWRHLLNTLLMVRHPKSLELNRGSLAHTECPFNQRVECAIKGTFLTRPVKKVGLVAQFGSARPDSDFRGLSGKDDGGPAEEIGGGCIGGVVARDPAASYFEAEETIA